MNDLTQILIDAGEFIASGYFELHDSSLIEKVSRGLRRHFELSSIPGWDGEHLYPAGLAKLPLCTSALSFSYTQGITLDPNILQTKITQFSDTPAADALTVLGETFKDLYWQGTSIPDGYILGGAGYTHSILNYGRILQDGLIGYSQRIQNYRENYQDIEKQNLYAAMSDLLAGLESLIGRAIDAIRANLDINPRVGENLIAALSNAPMNPARNFYEAIVATNFMWYVEGCDNLGRFDQDLGEYLEADLSLGIIDREEALELVKVLWHNVDKNNAWNVAVGGTDTNGRPAYNTLTELCLEAAKGIRRPNLALRIRDDMPDKVFDLALDSISSGCGLPALYNENVYLDAIQDIYNCSKHDLYNYAFGGCTETMFHGCSNVGSVDAGVNMLAVLSDTIKNHLTNTSDFDSFVGLFLADMRVHVKKATDAINLEQRMKALHQPQPIRTLFIDDCLESGVEYNAGGARYNGSVFNLGGLANVVDSLVVLRDLVFGGKISAEYMISALESDSVNTGELERMVRECPKFGNDDDHADDIAIHIANEVFSEIRSHKCWRGDTTFSPACIMLIIYDHAGRAVGATPDGRRAYEPIVDSIGPVQGRDVNGPTAMIRSVSKLPLNKAIGTPVLNVRFSKSIFNSADNRENLKALVRTYFNLGGMQLQITVVDQDILKDAIEHGEKHSDLIVRIGGFSEYFNNLSKELKCSILERTEHC